MVEKYLISQEYQDNLQNGLLKTDKGGYVKIETLGIRDETNNWKKFANYKDQDKLSLGLIKYNETNEYIPVNKISEIESQPLEKTAKELGLVGILVAGTAGALYGIDYLVKKIKK